MKRNVSLLFVLLALVALTSSACQKSPTAPGQPGPTPCVPGSPGCANTTPGDNRAYLVPFNYKTPYDVNTSTGMWQGDPSCRTGCSTPVAMIYPNSEGCYAIQQGYMYTLAQDVYNPRVTGRTLRLLFKNDFGSSDPRPQEALETAWVGHPGFSTNIAFPNPLTPGVKTVTLEIYENGGDLATPTDLKVDYKFCPQ